MNILKYFNLANVFIYFCFSYPIAKLFYCQKNTYLLTYLLTYLSIVISNTKYKFMLILGIFFLKSEVGVELNLAPSPTAPPPSNTHTHTHTHTLLSPTEETTLKSPVFLQIINVALHNVSLNNRKSVDI